MKLVSYQVENQTRLGALVGNVIATGTPYGVGSYRDPPTWLQSGDTVSVEVEGLGSLINHCVSR